MKKTALQELIEYQENQYRLWVELGSVNENEGVIMLDFIEKAKSLLEKEKQDLIEAYNLGENPKCTCGLDYYNQKFEYNN